MTPDSFSDGGLYAEVEAAVAHGKALAAQGADIIDVGGESTRPGAGSITVEEELRRVLPVIEQLAPGLAVPISIDTSKARVAREAVRSGARLINDVSGLRADPEMPGVVADTRLPVVLMHMQGTPRTMQHRPVYRDVVGEILQFFEERLEACERAGIGRDQIIVDPGIGFGKTVPHTLEILRRLRELAALGRPLLIGPSRKSFIGHTLDLPVAERLEGTAAAVAISIVNGAQLIRVHDVEPMARVARMVDAVIHGAPAKS